ncbi:unnamed protein product [Rangifer tarandus platyrhynchus]|uniref:Uncharacterized protein n=2 Tax=Rangifer tarandus platyrhynchus TaxID=3082113 RepID=A0ABN8XZU3_RANTA|nr:unnamed protein product [Rangifer tarandus platyrhynchus]CAI9712650.1 unnamed protein product [Rangifer tarandus platyrhynchus]
MRQQPGEEPPGHLPLVGHNHQSRLLSLPAGGCSPFLIQKRRQGAPGRRLAPGLAERGAGSRARAAGPSPGTTRTRLPAAGPQPPGATGGPQRLRAEPQEMQKHCRHPPSRRRLSLCEAPPTCSRWGRSAEEPGPARVGAQLSAVWGRERRERGPPREKRVGEEEGTEGRGSG